MVTMCAQDPCMTTFKVNFNRMESFPHSHAARCLFFVFFSACNETAFVTSVSVVEAKELLVAAI